MNAAQDPIAARSPAALPAADNKRIVFINPPYERIGPGYGFIKHITNRSPSLGLLHLASEVRQFGWEPSIIESDIEDLDVNGVVERVVELRPAYVGITLFTVGVAGSVAICERIRQKLPETVILVGGPHVASMGPETMERFDVFDVAVQGEGERILIELLRALEGGRNLAGVRGVIFRDAGGVVRVTAPPVVQMQLDDLPFPAWDLLPNFPHPYKLAIYDYPKGPCATIAASRGCPFHCKFCDTSTFGAKVRFYSPAKVIEMMGHLHERYGVRHVLFVDDLFLASKKRATEFCELLIASGLPMTWSCAARVDTVRPELLELMKKAGCWQISFGLETGSDEMLRKMDKCARVAKSEAAVTWTAAAGIRVKGLFMLGYPGETPESIEETKAFVRRIPMTIMNMTKFTPYPGSPIYRELYRTNIKEEHWGRMNGMNFVWAPEGMTVEELDRQYQEVLRSFYQYPRVRREYVKMSVKYPGHLLRLSRAGLGLAATRLRNLVKGRKGLMIEAREEIHLDGPPLASVSARPAAAQVAESEVRAPGCETGKAAGTAVRLTVLGRE